MSLITTRTARAVIYFCCIGGLLVFNSLVVMFIWNTLVPLTQGNSQLANDQDPLTFLEAAGLSAFAYVIAFSVRYGVRSEKSLSIMNYAKRKVVTEEQRKSDLRNKCNNLTPEQRQALKNELIATCGCKESDSEKTSVTSQREPKSRPEIVIK